MSAGTRSLTVRRSVFAALAAAMVVSLALTGCGGGSSANGVPLPPGGVAIGNLVCTNNLAVDTKVAHGQQIVITFTLRDVNTNVVGRDLPISFDVVGGTLLPPPTHTDALGTATVTFVASDYGYVGAAHVRLIQPNARLECDAAFTILIPACILRAEVLDAFDAIVVASDACGDPAITVERHQTRKIRYTITRPDPDTQVEEPVPGAFIHVVASGLVFMDTTIGPTDGNGQVTLIAVPLPTGVGLVTVDAEVVHVDLDGPNGVPDGINDEVDCNTCQILFNVINPICDDDGADLTPTVDYFSTGGAPKAAPLRPGESAEITALFELDGMPLAGRPVLVDAESGFIDGSLIPVTVLTDMNGFVTVTYTAMDGFSGTDTVTFQDLAGTLQCVQTAEIDVVTCDFDFTFTPDPPVAGGSHQVDIVFTNVDPMTLIGEQVALDVVGGFFTVQPPYYTVMDVGGGTPGVSATFNVTPGYSGDSVLSVSFVSGYPCTTVSKPFTIDP